MTLTEQKIINIFKSSTDQVTLLNSFTWRDLLLDLATMNSSIPIVSTGDILLDSAQQGSGGRIYGTNGTPLTSTTFTVSTSTLVEGSFAVIYSSAASTPSFSPTPDNSFNMGNYVANGVNILTLQYHGGATHLRHVNATAAPALPSDNANLRGWYRGSNIDGSNNSTLTNGALVSSWHDSSGGGRTLTNGGGSARPSFVSASNSLQFDGTNTYLSTTNLGITSQPYTVSIVVNPDSGNTGADGPWGNNSGSGVFMSHDSNSWRWYAGSFSSSQAFTDSVTKAYTAVFDGGNVTVYDGSNSSAVITAEAVGSGTMSNDLVVGAITDSPTFLYHGRVLEVITYNEALTGSNLTDHLSYISTEFGL